MAAPKYDRGYRGLKMMRVIPRPWNSSGRALEVKALILLNFLEFRVLHTTILAALTGN
jgi:hypothetical protein